MSGDTFGPAISLPWVIASAFTVIIYTAFLEFLGLAESRVFSEATIPMPPTSWPGLDVRDWFDLLVYPFELLAAVLLFVTGMFQAWSSAVAAVDGFAAVILTLTLMVPVMLLLIWVVPVLFGMVELGSRAVGAIGDWIPFT